VRLVPENVFSLWPVMEPMMRSQFFAVLWRVRLVRVRGRGLDLKLNVTMHLRRRCTRRNQQTFRCLLPRMRVMDLLTNACLRLAQHLRRWWTTLDQKTARCLSPPTLTATYLLLDMGLSLLTLLHLSPLKKNALVLSLYSRQG
jgi:hypothetical protein